MKNEIKLELGFMRHKTDMPHISQEIVDYAIANNQTYFETCYFYLDNKCEEFIYSLLTKYNREDYELCGKMPVYNIMEQYGVNKCVYGHLHGENSRSVKYLVKNGVEYFLTSCDKVQNQLVLIYEE